jgi:hypothetical protein
MGKRFCLTCKRFACEWQKGPFNCQKHLVCEEEEGGRRKEALKIQRRQTRGPLPSKILGLTLDVTLLRGVQVRYLTLRVKLISGKLSGITLDGLPYLEARVSKVAQQGRVTLFSGLRTWITTLIAIPSNNLNIIYCT